MYLVPDFSARKIAFLSSRDMSISASPMRFIKNLSCHFGGILGGIDKGDFRFFIMCLFNL